MFEAQIKTTEPQTVAFKVMRGAYDQTPQGYGELYGWVERYGLQPVGMPAAIYLTMPDVTPMEAAEWELWAPIAGGAGEVARDEEGFGVKRLEAETVASTMHKGPYDEVAPAYAELGKWISEEGYQVVGPPREIYYSDPEIVPPSEYLTEIQIPVAKT
ncbi:MAG TPA: GyrI-like domain-containing protein [Coriobacteriia bacterium]|nr:GyrI-like domain-containing protein [Coriobacteriia bacterium]